jgi:hypothetical protein
LRFTEEEAEDAKKGIPPRHQVSPSTFINSALDVEDLQYVATAGDQID